MVQLEQDEYVVRQPADEESSDECGHDFEGFGGFCHPVVSKFEADERVTDDDDEERHNKSCEETTNSNYLVAVQVWSIIVQANGPAQVSANVPKNHRGNTQRNGKKPSDDNDNGCLFNSAIVLGPNRKRNWHKAIYTDEDQEEDAAEHVDEHNTRSEFAQELAKDPLLHHHVGDAEWEEGTENKVRHSKAQVPGGVDCLLHLEARNPDDHSVSTKAQQKDNHVDHD